jgi:hypothetical protein
MTALEGSDIIGALLVDYSDFAQIAAADAIKAGRLPDGTPLPAILVRVVSSVDRQPLVRGALVRRTDRVSVAVRAESHEDRKALISAVRRCCAGQTGNIGGGLHVSILTAGMGPDVNGPGDSFEKTQDFRVSWDTED